MRISDWSSDVCSADLAHRAAGRRVVDRPQIEVPELVRRKQGETPTPRGAARQIVGKIIVRGDLGARADPDAPERIAIAQLDRIRFVEPVKMRRNVDRGEIDGARLALFLGLVDTAEDVGELARADPEIHLDRKSTRMNSSH